MTLFADASALIAIIAAERDALGLAHNLEQDRDRLYSAISAWQTVAGLSHAYRLSVQQSQASRKGSDFVKTDIKAATAS